MVALGKTFAEAVVVAEFRDLAYYHANSVLDGQSRTLKILAVADEVDSRLYGNRTLHARTDPDLILGAGDLPAYYLDYLVSTLRHLAELGIRERELERLLAVIGPHSARW